ncbi:FAD-dependent oxidoreductase [Roseomonas sp. E05]|uniref:FAD-dependent oxidoreductase n=1 Tax=Roseomonas sp. E05 TaxID=3046310 RepID=UPI0024B8BD59|nr:FAD-dependent oxidoreductase [Roseomonas sp. E05]MDJ0388231.1 FAD-dependent oxidoreductase [Roseomonas sp. E05]
MHLVLAGAGHAHLEVLRHFGQQQARRNAEAPRLTLVAPDAITVYSGAVPGVVAGLLRPGAAEIPLAPLLARAGAEWIEDQVTGLDAGRRLVLLGRNPPLPYDLLSLNTGARPVTPPGSVPVRPWRGFFAALAALDPAAGRVAVIGAGVAGVELALALARRPGPHPLLLEAAPELLPGLPASFRAHAERALRLAGVSWRTAFPVERLDEGMLHSLEAGMGQVALAIACAGALPGLDLRTSGLACDAAGFPRVDEALCSVSHREVFGAGDGVAAGLPKAGVWAVRAGPVLAGNLSRALRGEPPRPWTPQRQALMLLGTGRAEAIGLWRGISFEGAWAWRWKRWLDDRFVQRYAGAGGGWL